VDHLLTTVIRCKSKTMALTSITASAASAGEQITVNGSD
jgi:hypothetical protein